MKETFKEPRAAAKTPKGAAKVGMSASSSPLAPLVDRSKPKKIRSWEEYLDAMKLYKAKHGHCIVNESHKQDRRLGRWAQDQRRLHRRGQLAEERRQKLVDIGFELSTATEKTWGDWLDCLKGYKREHGHCSCPPNSIWKGNALGQWVEEQRTWSTKGWLTQFQRQKLVAVGFSWPEDVGEPLSSSQRDHREIGDKSAATKKERASKRAASLEAKKRIERYRSGSDTGGFLDEQNLATTEKQSNSFVERPKKRMKGLSSPKKRRAVGGDTCKGKEKKIRLFQDCTNQVIAPPTAKTYSLHSDVPIIWTADETPFPRPQQHPLDTFTI